MSLHPYCPVSIGELVDKLSILNIKMRFIEDPHKRQFVQAEAGELESILTALNLEGVAHYLERLMEVNSTLWRIEDSIREKEAQQCFDHDFIQLARSVYHTNDERFRIKNEINIHYGSGLREMKSYKKYESGQTDDTVQSK